MNSSTKSSGNRSRSTSSNQPGQLPTLPSTNSRRTDPCKGPTQIQTDIQGHRPAQAQGQPPPRFQSSSRIQEMRWSPVSPLEQNEDERQYQHQHYQPDLPATATGDRTDSETSKRASSTRIPLRMNLRPSLQHVIRGRSTAKMLPI